MAEFEHLSSSHTHVREFIESMKSLGYPGTLSVESFRTPNFETVASCLRWLLTRYDHDIQLESDISTEGNRAAFLKAAGRFMFVKTRMKLNLQNLYAADSMAVFELSQVASLLQKAIAQVALDKSNETETMLFKKAFDVKAARSLVLEIIKAGATLYDDLASEMQLQRERSMAASTNTDIEKIENMLRESMDSLLQTVSSLEQQQLSCERDEKSLHATCEKRNIELERCKKRLSVLQNVRPAYLDEYEVLQKDLQCMFSMYLEKFHNLQWLESQLEAHNQEEQEKLQESFSLMRRLQQRLHDENLQILRGEEVTSSKETSESAGQIVESCLWTDVLLKSLNNTVPPDSSFGFSNPFASKDVSEGASEEASEANANEESTDDEF